MNCLKSFLTLCLCAAALLGAIEVKTPAITAKLSPRGAVMTSLSVKGKTWLCSFADAGSFTDRIMQNVSPMVQGLADTASIDFLLKEHAVTPAGTKVVFTSCIGVLPGLRLEKSYFFSAKAPVVKIEYLFKNIGSSTLPLALYTRSFFRSSDGKSTCFHPGKNGIEAIAPGETSLPKKMPAAAFLAVADESGAGFIHRFPADDTAGLLNWLIKGGYTQEYLSSQLPLLPGKTRLFKLEFRYSANVLADLKKGNFKTRKLLGELPVQVDRMCGIKRKASLRFFRSIPTPDTGFIDCSFNRQFNDSWRAVELPADKINAPLAVYSIENGVIAADSPLPFVCRGNRVVICIPGVNPELFFNPESCSRFNDFFRSRSFKRWYGPMTMKCRILFGKTAQKESHAPDIPAEGALIRNGSMDASSPKNKDLPAFMPYTKLKAFQGGIMADKSNSRFLRIGKYAMYSFFPEYQKEYTLSVRVRSVGGGGLSRIFVQFYDKDGKYLQKERRIVLATSNTFGWRKLEHRFFVPSHVAFLRILFMNGQKKGQYLDIDDLQLTLPVLQQKSIDRKTMLREEMLKLWRIPLPLLESISHDLETPHKKWFRPAAQEAKDLLFISGVGTRITNGRRRDIVELAQRLDMKYTHIPLIPKINNVVSAYSVYPTYFGKTVSEYTMECLKGIRKLPKVLCFTGVDFKNIKDTSFIKLMTEWQKKGVNFIFFSCNAVPNELKGKRAGTDFSALLPLMSSAPNQRPGTYQFFRNHKASVAVVNRMPKVNALIPDEQKYEAQCDYKMFYGNVYPWWEYTFLLDVQLLRHLSGIRSDAVLKALPGGCALVKAVKKFKGTLRIHIRDMHRELLVSRTIPVDLPQGGTLSIPDDFPLPGGIFAADLQLLDLKGRAVDAGAVRLFRKELTPLVITMKNKESIVPHPQKAEFSVEAPSLPAGSRIELEIFNQRSEVLYKSAPFAKKKQVFSVALPHLRTFYNYIRAKVIKDGKLLANVTKEFSVPGIPVEMNEFYGFTNPGMSGGAPIKNLAFDFAISGDPRWKHTPLSIRRIRTMGLIPIPRRGDEKMFRPYRDDVKTAPVRTPCFSSPEFHAQLQKDTRYMAEHCKFRYNDVNLLWAGDEMFLGRSVCTSPSCLAGFRKRMEKQFSTIGALNKNWGTSFKSFAEVLPQQLEELKSRDRLGPWLDHKMYMTTVFAENFFGKAKEELEKYVPNVKIGPTGTQKPGFGYNWHELMKYCRIVGYYSGVQTKVIHDLSDSSLMAGQCGGGYTHGHIDYEIYNYDTMWNTLINGGNLAYHYAGCAFRGDGAPTDNMRYYTKSLRELKSGIGKLYLSARPQPTVGVLYSQPSLFAAMGSCGQDEWQNSQTSWAKLLEDMRISARFFNYEELADRGVPKGLKAVVLPFALALSNKEAASLARFAAAGGTVIADCDAGIFDGHGRRRSAEERQEKLKFVNSLGFSIARYNFVQFGGTGGELASSGSGDAAFINKCRTAVLSLLKTQKITPFVSLTDRQGKEVGCTAKLRLDGPAHIYGFHLPSDKGGVGRFKDHAGQKARIKLSAPGHVYDIRNKKYLGKTDRWQMTLVPGWSQIFGVVPAKFEAVKLEAPSAVSRGTGFKVRAAAVPAQGHQVFRLTVTAPDGREIPCYSVNFRTPPQGGTREIFMPFNNVPGKYRIKVAHIMSDLSAEREIEVR